uniref:Allatostatin-A n=1 Tax=Agrotis ipsilon TaxID=56364 RepID=ALLA_AGRIP|nr:RecName: Full=Allatostatin-A; Contains: RecName: Full=Allatostatin-A-1; Short=AST-A-1; Contains: RecName: Full=Allatostatin-A-3; Short=AST-A-3; Contains: RecName: Full=Allatostatin-A-4; Short=AST-A-4; Contains: RecName: Full=Allatostatin-A-5; Short=AST-A-5; Contains: RecName: Full=Allatostatin-A-6; Short=AST-A-6; Contains: RecName: Full=Allatostatin-A-7; Short=AST-A-7; Contains: RecName: Full=Allatostatin-A-8; Short=AST-A-8; Contains: RecName: Full=Allatostatin-A-9; Short=AST-A-9; Flags: Precurs
MLSTSLPVCFLVIGAALCAPERMQNDPDPHDSTAQGSDNHSDHIAPLAKRSPHYDFGLGKRAYSYVSEYKRLPVYNFGLGKRSRPYSFGLGKRSVDEDQTNDDQQQIMNNDLDQAALAEFFDQYDDAGYEKRARPYSFGLGKRFADDDTSEEKRARAYDFGLGKRLPLYNFGLGKRARSYNFGLGKRLASKFNFGLGKRERDMHRFSFGLGKRSADDASTEDSDNYFDV